MVAISGPNVLRPKFINRLYPRSSVFVGCTSLGHRLTGPPSHIHWSPICTLDSLGPILIAYPSECNPFYTVRIGPSSHWSLRASHNSYINKIGLAQTPWGEPIFIIHFRQVIPNNIITFDVFNIWWRHQVETFSALLAICAGNSRVPGEFPAQRPVMRSFDVLFDLRLNKRLNKQSLGWWFETPSGSLWRQCNEKQNLF